MTKKFREIFIGLFNVLLPFVRLWFANSSIRKAIKTIEEQFGDNDIPENVQNEMAKNLIAEYQRSFSIKDKLEDKAKTNIIAITISITLVMGSSGVVSSAIKNQSIHLMQIVTVSLFIASVFFMIYAGIIALQVLMDKNKSYFYTGDVEGIEKNIDSRVVCYKSTQLNDKINHIRNNSIYTSFACIRNALVCLFIVMVLVLSTTFLPQPNIDSVPISMQNGQVFYSEQATTYLDANIVMGIVDEIDALIWKQFHEGKININQIVGLIDTNHNIFIKVKVVSDVEAIVLQVEPYIVP